VDTFLPSKHLLTSASLVYSLSGRLLRTPIISLLAPCFKACWIRFGFIKGKCKFLKIIRTSTRLACVNFPHILVFFVIDISCNTLPFDRFITWILYYQLNFQIHSRRILIGKFYLLLYADGSDFKWYHHYIIVQTI